MGGINLGVYGLSCYVLYSSNFAVVKVGRGSIVFLGSGEGNRCYFRLVGLAFFIFLGGIFFFGFTFFIKNKNEKIILTLVGI